MAALQSNGLSFRPFAPDDAEAFASAAMESVTTVGPWMPWCHADYKVKDALEWFALCDEGFANRSGYNFGVFSADGTELLGGGSLSLFNRLHNFCNLGYWVRQSKQRQGIATGIVHALAQYGFLELGLTRIEIVVAEGNVASDAVARKAGAQFESMARHRLLIGSALFTASVYSLIPSDITSNS